MANPDATLSFRDAATARAMLTRSPEQVMDLLLTSDLVFRGNLSHITRLSFMLNSLVNRAKRAEVPARQEKRRAEPRRSLLMEPCDEVSYLGDPGLSELTIDDFPRLARFLNDYFAPNNQERERLKPCPPRQGFPLGASVPWGTLPRLRQARPLGVHWMLLCALSGVISLEFARQTALAPRSQCTLPLVCSPLPCTIGTS